MEKKEFFVGKWELIKFSCANDEDWPLCNRHSNERIIGEFKESGQFIMYSGGDIIKTELYVYDPETQQLFLGKKYYWAEHVRKDEYLLFCRGNGYSGGIAAKIRKL